MKWFISFSSYICKEGLGQLNRWNKNKQVVPNYIIWFMVVQSNALFSALSKGGQNFNSFTLLSPQHPEPVPSLINRFWFRLKASNYRCH